MTAVVSTALVLLTAAFHQTAGALPLVERVAVLALAGGTAYLLDDAAAPVTTVAPQGQWRRRTPVMAVGVALLTAGWLGIQLLLTWRDAQPPVAGSSAELLVLGLVAIAAAALLFRFGDHEPGAMVAPLFVVLGLGVTILQSAIDSPIYLTDADPAPGRVVGWVAAGAVAVVVIVVAGREAAGEPRRVMRARAGRV